MSVYLAYSGIQDMFLTEKPDISHFRTMYKRDSPFITQTAEIPFDKSNPLPGDTLIATLPQKGDYIDNISLKLKLPSLVPASRDYIWPGNPSGIMYGLDVNGNQLFTLSLNKNQPVTSSNNWYIPSTIKNFTQIVTHVSCGENHTAVVTTNNDLFTFGANGYGQLGLGAVGDQNTPQRVTFFNSNVASVSCGDYHTAVVTTTNDLFTFGYNGDGELGLGPSGAGDQNTPQRVTFFNSNVASVSCGRFHTAVVGTTSNLFTFGANYNGELGLGPVGYQNTPQRVTFFNSNVASVSCGGYHTAVVGTTNNLFTFGYNSNGQLGLGDFTDRNTPQRVTFFNSNVASVSCGDYHTAVVTTTNDLFTFGANGYGELGLGPVGDQNTPQRVTFFNSNVASVSCGRFHTAVVGTTSNLFTFGANGYGQLGLGAVGDQNTPQRVTFFNSNVSCGNFHTAVIKNTNDLFTFGYNYYGQLGLGYNTSINTPTLVQFQLLSSNVESVIISYTTNKLNYTYIKRDIVSSVVFSDTPTAQIFGFVNNPIKLFGGYLKYLTRSTSNVFSGQLSFQETGWLSGNTQYFYNSYIDDISSKFINNTSLYIGKQLVQQFDAKFIRIKKEIDTSYKNYPVLSILEGSTNVVDFDRVYYYNIPFVKIPFYEIPLQDVQIRIDTNPFNTFDFYASLIVDYITISSKPTPSEHAIQVPQMSLGIETQMKFKNPVTQLFTDATNFKLSFNGEKLCDDDTSNISSFENHFSPVKTMNSIVFKGPINMSRIRDQYIDVFSNVYAESINFLKFDNGISGLMFDGYEQSKFPKLTGNVYSPQRDVQVLTYLFDSIPLTASNVITMYSMRRVSPDYTGPIVRLFNGTLEEDFYTDEKQSYLKTAYGTDIDTWASGNIVLVSIWYDQSGNGNDAYQNDSSRRPTISKQAGKYVVSIENPNIPFVSSYKWMNITNKIKAQQFTLVHNAVSFNFRGFVFGFQNTDYGFKINQLINTAYASRVGTSPGDFATGTDEGYSQSNWVQFPGSTNVHWWNNENKGETSNKQNFRVNANQWNTITSYAETLPNYDSSPSLDGGFSLIGRSLFNNPDQSYNGNIFELGFFSDTSLSSEHDEYFNVRPFQ
jgi:alpha-tubulin suppressor-like RCC1 family protein